MRVSSKHCIALVVCLYPINVKMGPHFLCDLAWPHGRFMYDDFQKFVFNKIRFSKISKIHSNFFYKIRENLFLFYNARTQWFPKLRLCFFFLIGNSDIVAPPLTRPVVLRVCFQSRAKKADHFWEMPGQGEFCDYFLKNPLVKVGWRWWLNVTNQTKDQRRLSVGSLKTKLLQKKLWNVSLNEDLPERICFHRIYMWRVE